MEIFYIVTTIIFIILIAISVFRSGQQVQQPITPLEVKISISTRRVTMPMDQQGEIITINEERN